VIEKAEAGELELPKGDMVIFDESRVAVNSYDQNGLVVSTDFYDQADDISKFLKLKSELQKRAKAI
jgi:hypothetical protein